MGIIYLMLLVSLVIALFFLATFFWAAKSGQYEDDYSPSIRILFEDESEENKSNDGNREVQL
jgi:cbb3-type cytochrome oxidase maturation protein